MRVSYSYFVSKSFALNFVNIDIVKQKYICLHNKVRVNKMIHPIITILGSFIPLVMPITWLDFGEILLETFFGEFKKNSNFFNLKHSICHVSVIIS